MKKFVKVFCLLFVITFMLVMNIKAREIVRLNSFQVYGHKNTHRTAYSIKTKVSPYVVNLEEARGRRNVVLETMILNSNGEWRNWDNRWGKTKEGERTENGNNASKGYKYALEFRREYFWDGDITINGTYSVDNRN